MHLYNLVVFQLKKGQGTGLYKLVKVIVALNQCLDEIEIQLKTS